MAEHQTTLPPQWLRADGGAPNRWSADYLQWSKWIREQLLKEQP